MHLNEEKRHLKGKTCRKWANELKIFDSDSGAIYMYNTIIFKDIHL